MKKSCFFLAVFIFSVMNTVAQIRVTGLVKGEANETLPGANVVISGTTRGTITDNDGKFEITVPTRETELIVSYIGYLEQRMVVGDQTYIEVILNFAALQMDEVIILGYGVVKRSNVVGAISSVGSEDFQDRPVANPVQALQGKASGISIIQNSGAPGEGAQINIRGIGTVNNSNPLYVVDGIVTGGIGHINPSDIESVEVLKDAASAAIYGAKGANGVIIVNTKTAKAGEMRVQADYYYGARQYWNSIDIMDSYEWHIHNLIRSSNPNVRNDIDAGKDAYYARMPNINWLDEISQVGNTQRANISVSQGIDKMNYYLSAGFYDENGLVRTSAHRRQNLLFKVQAKPVNWVTLDLKAAYQGSKSDHVAGGDNSIIRDALISAPQRIYDERDGFLLNNPLKRIEQNYDKSRNDRTDLNADLKINVFDGLVFQSRVGFELISNESNNYGMIEPMYELYLYELGDFQRPSIDNELNRNKKFLWENIVNYNNSFGRHDIGILAFTSMDNYSRFRVRGSGNSFLYNNVRYTALDLVAYNRNLSGAPESERNVGLGGRATYGYDNRYLLEVNFRADASSNFPAETRWGYFPSLSVGWRMSQEAFLSSIYWIDQIKLRASIGQSGNNRISAEDQYTIYGNNNLYTFGTTTNNYFYDAYFADNIGNPSLLWEKTTTYNVGLDYGFFNAIYGSLEYFQRYTSDMLIRVPVTDATGLNTYPRQNGGDVLNSGVEVELGLRRSFGHLKVHLRGNISFIQNKVTRLGDRDDPIYGGDVSNPGIGQVTYTAIGQPIGQFYGFVIDPVNPIYRNRDQVLADPLYANMEQPSLLVGTFKFLDLNGDGRISKEDKTIIGSPYPDFFGGFNTDLEYKNFSLNVFWQYSYGNDVFNVMKFWLDVGGTNQSNNGKGQTISNKRKENIGKFISLNTVATYPFDPVYNPENIEYANLLALNEDMVKIDENFLDGNKSSTFFVEDASYLRLKNITLSYNMSNQLAQRLKLSRVRIFVGAENLLTFTKYSGLDPEIGSTRTAANANTSMGIDYGTYPQARTFFLGVSLGL